MGWNGGRRRPDGLTRIFEEDRLRYRREHNDELRANAAAYWATPHERADVPGESVSSIQVALTPTEHVECGWSKHGWFCPQHSKSEPREGADG